jgi:D-apionolactonase
MATPLVAGPLRLDYDSGDIRCVRLGDEEILRRVYVAFQDRNWTARPWRILSEDIDDRGDAFTVRVRARGSFDAESFAYSLDISGDADGTLRYALRGEASEPFLRNRLGICVLHPMAGFAGRGCEILHADGSVEATSFPERISPHQPFLDVAAMTYPVGASGRARLDFAGEVFETEDHRNWSDASYKTYCTPISLPFPVEVQPGDVIDQSVALTLSGVTLQSPPPEQTGPIEIAVGTSSQPVPDIGVRVTEAAWSGPEASFLRSLALGHIQADIDATGPDAAERIADTAQRARDLHVKAFIALHTAGDPDPSLAAPLREARETLAGIWVVHPDEKVTSRATLDAWRSRLGPDLPWGCGTHLYFTELNRQPADTTGLDWTTFSVNPQVHAHDDRSVLQNTATLEVIAAEAPRLAGATRIHVGPVSLRPRFNPNATDPESDVSSTDLPADVDARQRTWFAAAWTALALRSLAIPGTVSAVTLFDDLGWTGLRARDAGPEDAAFPSNPGEEFPVADVIRALTRATHVVPTSSSDPEVVDAVVLDAPDGRRALVVNLTADPQEARLIGTADARVAIGPHDVVSIDLPGRAS